MKNNIYIKLCGFIKCVNFMGCAAFEGSVNKFVFLCQ